MIAKHPCGRPGLSLFFALTICVLVAVCVPASSIDKPAATGTPVGSASQQPSAAMKQRALMALGNLPLTFEPNQGQTDARVKYLSRGHGYDLFLTSKEAVFTMPLAPQDSALHDLMGQKQMSPSAQAKPDSAPAANASNAGEAVLRMTMLGANAEPVITAEDQQPGKTNYFIGNDPKNWHANIPGFARVHYRDVYPGVDVIYHGAHQLEFDVVVNPGANPGQVKLNFTGAQRMTIDESGDIVLTSEAGEVRLHHPVAYQENNGVRQSVDARFVVKKANQVVFALGSYDRSRQLVIDPPISVTYATYLGGGPYCNPITKKCTAYSGEEAATGINVDSAGNAYVTGGTNSGTFPGCTGMCAGELNGNLQAYITQIAVDGTLGFTTILGCQASTGNVYDQAIAINTYNLYIAGGTSCTDLPNHGNSIYGGGATDGFVAKLGLDGTPIWSTYIGGSGGDEAFGISLDSAGDAFVAGQTTSTDLKVVKALPQGGSYNGAGDAFVAEVDSSGNITLLSYIGGSGLDLATGVSWNAATGHVYVGGSTQSYKLDNTLVGLPTTTNAYQKTCGTDTFCNLNSQPPKGQPKDDAFVAAFDPANPSQYVFLTYVGGEFFDDSTALTSDIHGNVYITGKTQSKSFPKQNPLPGQGNLNGVQNAFVTVLDPTGSSLVYSTYLGGNGFDEGLGIVVDPNFNAYVTGSTACKVAGCTSTNFPTQDPSQQTFGGGNPNTNPFQFDSDAFVSELNWDPNTTTLSLIFSTYLGGSGDEDIYGGFISIDSKENIYVIGDTNSTDFPTQAPSGGSVIDGLLNQVPKGQQQPTCQAKNRLAQVVNVTCTDSFVAMYGSNTEEIVVTLIGTGTGKVTSVPPGMTCSGSRCTASFPTATPVELTGVPGVNSVFTAWSGDGCSGSGTCDVVLNSNQFVTAQFTQVAANISVTIVGSGKVTSSPAGINCPGTCNANFPLNTKLTLTATPGAQFSFTGWSGGGCSGTGLCSMTVTSDQAVTATFTAWPTVSTTVVGSGTVSSSPAGINCPTTCVASFAPATKVTLTATPAAQFSFTGWSGGGCSGTGTCSLTVNSNQAVTATFTKNPNLTVTVVGSGTVTSSPAGINCPSTCVAGFAPATKVTLTAAPAAEFSFTGWSGGGCSGTGTCTLTLNSDQAVTATFTQVVASLTVTVVGSGSVTSSPAGINCPGTCVAKYAVGTKVTLTAAPASKITFTGWSNGGCSGTGSCVVTLNSNQAVTATFQGFTISATALSPSSVAPGGSAQSTATITPSGGFNVNSVTLACSIAPVVTPAPTCTFGAISGGASTLTVSTTGPTASLTPSRFNHSGLFYAMFLPIGGMAFLGTGFGANSKKKKLLGFLLVCLVLSGLVFLGACSSSNHGGGGGGGGGGTPAGNYTVTVTGTATGFVQGGNPPQLTLNVQ